MVGLHLSCRGIGRGFQEPRTNVKIAHAASVHRDELDRQLTRVECALKDPVDQCFEEASAADAPAVDDSYSRLHEMYDENRRLRGYRLEIPTNCPATLRHVAACSNVAVGCLSSCRSDPPRGRRQVERNSPLVPVRVINSMRR